MTLLFIDIGVTEALLIFLALILVIAVGNYGKGTQLGYWGTIVLALLTSPIIAFIVVFFLKRKAN